MDEQASLSQAEIRSIFEKGTVELGNGMRADASMVHNTLFYLNSLVQGRKWAALKRIESGVDTGLNVLMLDDKTQADLEPLLDGGRDVPFITRQVVEDVLKRRGAQFELDMGVYVPQFGELAQGKGIVLDSEAFPALIPLPAGTE